MNFSSLEMVNYYQLSKVARQCRAPKLIGEELLIPTIAGVRLQSLVNTSGIVNTITITIFGQHQRREK